MRRADDAAAVVQAVAARSGIPFHVIDHDEEGLLTLARRDRRPPDRVAAARRRHRRRQLRDRRRRARRLGERRHLPLGAARLTQELIRDRPADPRRDRRAACPHPRDVADPPDLHPGEIVAVGGTASNLLKLLPATAIDRMLTRRRITVALAMLTVERERRGGVAPPHPAASARGSCPPGALIVDALLERFAAERLHVSEEGIRSGLLLATAAAGPAWRDRLPRLAGGWSRPRSTDRRRLPVA